MALVDDLKEPLEVEERERRRFLALLGGGALGLASLGSTLLTLRFLWPPVEYEEESRFPLGRAESFTPNTVVAIPTHRVYVVRTDEGLYALSAVCTHLGCITRYDPAKRGISCPCHGSRFTEKGEVVGGPAPRPLHRLALLLEDGVVWVDTSKRVSTDALLRVA
ncbi:MAG: Rieske 2Fe-2S domain-containing protein [Deltaproteobacteria bacterium]|nr:Rieske 2Fe-2S domain-containing protein [Deltaproteobacteria bacterium]